LNFDFFKGKRDPQTPQNIHSKTKGRLVYVIF